MTAKEYKASARKCALRPCHAGFTLVEVIVVLVILAILAAVAVPSFTGWIDNSKDKVLITECRSAVMAAQTLASEQYSTGGTLSEAEVITLAELKGTVSGIALDPDSSQVLHLRYTNDRSVTFCRYPDHCPSHDEEYNLEGPGTPWAENTSYKVGDEIVIDGIHFECLRKHTSGLSGAARNPTTSTNKSTWMVTGFDSGADNTYFSRLRYAEGVSVVYIGVTYVRTSEDPNGGSTPSATSKHWDVVE